MTAGTSTVTLYPYVVYRDADAAMRWLEKALGFERREDARDDAGNVQHAELSLGPAIVMLRLGRFERDVRARIPGALEEHVDILDRAVHERAAGGEAAERLPGRRRRSPVRLARFHRPRPGGQPLGIRHLPT
jgi:uncharacterized glyoxalase superfamily protein PhnB